MSCNRLVSLSLGCLLVRDIPLVAFLQARIGVLSDSGPGYAHALVMQKLSAVTSCKFIFCKDLRT